MYGREKYLDLVDYILGDNALDEDTACRACINRLYYCLFNELLDLNPELKQKRIHSIKVEATRIL